MADKPILFSGQMVRALLAGRKKQTRRIMKVKSNLTLGEVIAEGEHGQGTIHVTRKQLQEPRITVGDRLYVRENLTIKSNDQGIRWLGYAADGKDVWPLTQWHKDRNSVPSIHMPRWASRINLTVTDVRVERLQDISAADAIDEGFQDRSVRAFLPAAYGLPEWPDDRCGPPRNAYRRLWEAINGEGSWESNPWVAAYTFTVQMGNIDALAGIA